MWFETGVDKWVYVYMYSIGQLAQIYAGSFFAIPLVRWFLVRNRNAQIEKRNQARQLRARALESPDVSLRRKLLSARDMAQRTRDREVRLNQGHCNSVLELAAFFIENFRVSS
nr:uncharacterized protein, chloroplastic [Quercus suber]